MKNLNVLCLHGIGAKEDRLEYDNWTKDWRECIQKKTNKDTNVNFLEFDKFFKKQEANFGNYLSFLTDAIFGISRPQKGMIRNIKEDYLDMVIEFFEYESVVLNLREHLRKELSSKSYDIIYAHSLGSIICYDFFHSESVNNTYNHITLITAGSQLGHHMLPKFNPLQSLKVKAWYNLHNRYDKVFADRKIGDSINKCKDYETLFGGGFFDLSHDGGKYLSHSSPDLWKNIRLSYS